jgi:transposase
MRGPKPRYKIDLTVEEATELQRLIRAHTTSHTLRLRAQIVLTAYEHASWNNQQVADCVGTSDRLVRKWRRRWVETHSLQDAPRSGAPRRFSP